MNRRDFLYRSAVLGAVGLLPFPITHTFARPTYKIKLPIPPILYADEKGNVELSILQGETHWDDTRKATTFGINGTILGPTIRVRTNDNVRITVKNQLKEVTTLHWHGLLVPGSKDGGPQQMIQSGESWQTEFRISQPAATCWYHPHTHQRTGYQVAMGIGGFLLIDDEVSITLPLPKEYGVDDIPLVIQDKRLGSDGEIDYKLDAVSASVGWFGNTMLTNGVISPEIVLPKGWVRFRLLNGCNARILVLATSDKRPMHVVASDGGFLSEPVTLDTITLLMGERFEVLVDTRDGKPFDILSLPTNQIGMSLPPFDKPISVLSCRPLLDENDAKLPETLSLLDEVEVPKNIKQRNISLTMDHQLHMYGMAEFSRRYGSGGMMNMMGNQSPNQEQLLTSNSINGRAFMLGEPEFDVKRGHYEIWSISGMMTHPFHVHGTQFRILSENGREPAPHRRGWKDIVLVNSGESKILVKFDHISHQSHAYMAHCHLLEHEDTGMMLSFTVS